MYDDDVNYYQVMCYDIHDMIELAMVCLHAICVPVVYTSSQEAHNFVTRMFGYRNKCTIFIHVKAWFI